MTENSPDLSPRRRPLWLKIAGIGCGGVIVLALIVVGLIAQSWPRLTGYFQQAKSMLSQVVAVQAAVQKKSAGEVRITIKSESGVQGSILSVSLVNSPLMDRINVDSADGRRLALEVAATARDALPPDGRYDNYEVLFLRERGAAGMSVSGSWSFRFTAGELPSAKTEAGASGK